MSGDGRPSTNITGLGRDRERSDEESLSRCSRIDFILIGVSGLVFCYALVAVCFPVFILRPKPVFVLQGGTVHEFNATSPSSLESSNPNFLSMNVEAVLSSLNPDGRSGIRYSQLRAYASYRGKHITLPAQLPGSYQGHKAVADWSPVLQGNMIALAPDLGSALARDLSTGSIPIDVKVDGCVKRKPVILWLNNYRLRVSCPAVLVPKASRIEVPQLTQHCSVKVRLDIF